MNPPVFAHGHLRLYLLSLLEEQPRHGYELIQALTERFDGAYAPSAGTIYPRLAKMEEDGLVSKSTSGRKTIYEITPAGREELERRRHELDAIDTNIEDSVRRLAEQLRAGVTTATAQLREEFGPTAKDFGANARKFASETASQARQAWSSGVQAGQRTAADESGRGSAASDTEPRPQDAPREPADAAGTQRASSTEDARGRHAADSSAASRAEIALERFRGDLRREIRDGERAGRFSESIHRMLEDELSRVLAQAQLALGTQRRPE